MDRQIDVDLIGIDAEMIGERCRRFPEIFPARRHGGMQDLRQELGVEQQLEGRRQGEQPEIAAILNESFVPIKVDLDVTAKLLPQIDAAMAAEGGNKPYFQAAAFYYDHGQDLSKAKEWVEAAVKQREAYYIVHLKAKILAKLGDKEGAIAAANRSMVLAKESRDSAYVKLNEDLISSLK